jgi:hypothetical protein
MRENTPERQVNAENPPATPDPQEQSACKTRNCDLAAVAVRAFYAVPATAAKCA